MSAPASNSGQDSTNTVRKIAAGLVWLGLIAGYVVFTRSRGLSPLEAAEELRTIMSDHWWGPVLFIVAYSVRPLVLFPATLLTILGGLAFGVVGGAILTVIAANLSTAVTYGVGRFFGSERLVERLTKLTGSLLERARSNPFETTLIMRLIYLPFDSVGYVAGIIGLSFLPFMAGSALGTLPGTVAFVGFGASVESLDAGRPDFDFRILGASLALAIAGSLFSRWLRTRTTEQQTHAEQQERSIR